MARILLVEDDESIISMLTDILSQDGHQVTVNDTGAGVLEQVRQTTPKFDLVITDIVLPQADGLAITRELSVFDLCPVMLISTKGSDVDRVVGLSQGADDYLTKPFNPAELLLRVKAIIRRSQKSPLTQDAANERVQLFNRIELDLETRTLHYTTGENQLLTDGEHQLLLYLMGERGKICSRKQILSRMKSQTWTPSNRSLDVLIGRLRKKLEDDSQLPQKIITIRGKGYMLASAK